MKKLYTVEFDINYPAIFENIEAENEDEAVEQAQESLEFTLHEMTRDGITDSFNSEPRVNEQDNEI